MSLYIRDDKGDLLQVAEVIPGPDHYEKELEELLWKNLELLGQDALFPLRRQAPLPAGGVPDILALDKQGRVVVIEVKRDFERKQLAQALEYAGWARSTNLDELASLYPPGQSAFFTDWQEFTESATPVTVSHSPLLVLVARSIHTRTGDALQFLRDNNLPVSVILISIYEDDQKRWLIDIDGDSGVHGLVSAPHGELETIGRKTYMINGRRVRLSDLVAAKLLTPNTEIEFTTGKKTVKGTITAEGNLISNEQSFSNPTAAAEAAVGHAVDGWVKWRVPLQGGITLAELRLTLLESLSEKQSDSD